jgi:glycosyltransferase involved in cell wall biosynthesis
MNRAQRITLIGNSGISMVNFRLPLIHDLVAAGHHVEALTPDWTPEQRQAIQSAGATSASFPMDRTGTNPIADLRSWAALFHYLRRTRPDIVLTYATKTNIWGTLAAAWAVVPRRVMLVAGLGYAFIEGPPNGRTFSRSVLQQTVGLLYRAAARSAHRIIVQNPDDGALLRSTWSVPQEKIIHIHGTGVPLEDWPFHPPHTDPITFTLVARLLREKGVLEFLEAAQQIKAVHPEVRFWLLGPLDDNPGGLKASDIQPWVESGVVEWPGLVDVKPWLARTSVFVLPSYREGVPRSTQEAMAMGRPVITTDAPGCRETVVDGVNGYLIPPRNVPALVEAMEQFIKNPAHIETMGKESRRLAEERFDVRTINVHMMRILCEEISFPS